MTENRTPLKNRLNSLTVILISTLLAVAVVAAVLTLLYPSFIFSLLPGGTVYEVGGSIYEVIYVVLTLATDVLYLYGGGVIVFGSTLIIIRFVKLKLFNPFQPSLSTRHLSGYLTLGLEIFIGAEIIRTVVVRTPSEFALLILVIASRGLFSLILYLERRWHGSAETE